MLVFELVLELKPGILVSVVVTGTGGETVVFGTEVVDRDTAVVTEIWDRVGSCSRNVIGTGSGKWNSNCSAQVVEDVSEYPVEFL